MPPKKNTKKGSKKPEDNKAAVADNVEEQINSNETQAANITNTPVTSTATPVVNNTVNQNQTKTTVYYLLKLNPRY